MLHSLKATATRAVLLVIPLLGAWTFPAQAQTAYLVKDINTSDDPSIGLNPIGLARAGQRLFFLGSDGGNGGELWVSDGTSAGTTLVTDISPGPSSPFQNGRYSPVDVNGTLFFNANYDLWKSDGTAAGTKKLKTVGSITSAVAVGGVLYFASLDSPRYLLWRSDGTPEGTWVVREMQAASLTAAGGTLFFVGEDSSTGPELWKSDGTSAGTTLVRDICPGPCGSLLGWHNSDVNRGLVALGDQIIFSADDGQVGVEPWVSDGTFDGTHLIRDIRPGPLPSDLTRFEPVGSVAYFGAYEGVGASGTTLWRTDGTLANTVQVSAVSPYGLANLGGAPYFLAETSPGSTGLWTTDVTTAGVRLVKDICGSCSVLGLTNYRLAVAGGLIYFTTRPDSSLVFSLWRSDGTEAGTHTIGGEFQDGSVNGGPGEFTGVSSRAYFVASDGASGTELWRSDGTTAGTAMVVDRVSHGSALPQGLTSVGAKVYFAAREPATGLETWSSDGTPEGTNLVTDLYSGTEGSVEGSTRVALGPWLLTGGRIGPSGTGADIGLWRTDGTEEGTTRIVAGVAPREFEVVGGIAYFTASDYEFVGISSNRHLWRSDGTPGGTWVVKTWETIPERPSELTNVDGVLFFRGPGGLWKCDGTTEGTVLVKPISTPMELTGLGSTLYFKPYGWPLWRSNGTSAGTFSVRPDLQPLANTTYQGPVTAGSKVFFVWQTAGSAELWKSDGTAAGTLPIKPIPGWRLNADGGSGLLFFAPAYYDGEGYNLWKSDGTSNGTVLVKDLPSISDLLNIDGTLYFAAYDPEHGRELWKSDGTPEGTVLVQDIAPGPASSNPQRFARAGGLVYFSADDGTTGAELWAFPVPDSAVALMVTPSPASQLTGSTVTFTWAPAAVATEYWLTVGTTFGGGQIYAGSQGRNLSKVVSGIVADGRTIYVRLWTLFGGSWRSVDYTYTAAVPRPATMVTPVPGAALNSSVVTFDWEAGAGATAYWLYVGTTPGGKQIYPGSQVTNLSATVSGVPTTGATVYVRLFSLIGGVWQHIDYTYTTGAPAVALTVNPTAVQPGQTVQVTLQGGPGNLRDWIGLHTSTAPDTTYLDWKYLNGTRTIPTTGLTSANLTFTMPTTAGTYNFRFFQNGGFTKLATSPAVTVGTVVSPVLSVTPTSLAFGDVAVGATLDKSVVVKNTGGGTLSGTGSVTGTGYTLIGTASYSLTANQEMTLTVRFAPTTAGSANGTLTLTGAAGAAVPLTGNGTSAGPSLTIVGGVTTVVPGATVQLQVANGPGNPKDWVGLHAAAAADTVYLDWKYLNGTRTAPVTGVTTATLTFTMPTAPGAYQFRFFANNTFARLATSATVTVTPATTPTLTVSATTVSPGQSVQVTVQDGPGNPKDWIALAVTGAANTSYSSWFYLNGTRTAPSVGLTAATVTFTMPTTPGTYEFRFFQDNTYTRLATSPTVAVQ